MAASAVRGDRIVDRLGDLIVVCSSDIYDIPVHNTFVDRSPSLKFFP